MLKRYFCSTLAMCTIISFADHSFALSVGSQTVVQQHPLQAGKPVYDAVPPQEQRKQFKYQAAPAAPQPTPIYAHPAPRVVPAPVYVAPAPQPRVQPVYEPSQPVQASPQLYGRDGNTFFEPSEFRVAAFSGYATSSLNWNIGIPTTGPDILSELTWRDMKSYVVGGSAEYKCRTNWCTDMMVFASGYGNRATSGKNQDSDFTNNGRVGEFSRSNNNADGSGAQGFSIALGYDLAMDTENIGVSLIPKIGYSYDGQQMKITDGNQTVPANGSFPGLNSRYETQWDGPFAGLETRIRLFNRHEFRAQGSFAKVDYNAGATWNLRSDFAQPTSFEHKADGFGRTLALGYSFWITPEWEFKLDGKYEFWKAGPGVDTIFFSSGAIGTTRLNEVKSKAHTYTAGLGYRF